MRTLAKALSAALLLTALLGSGFANSAYASAAAETYGSAQAGVSGVGDPYR